MKKIILFSFFSLVLQCAFALNDNKPQAGQISGSSIFTAEITKFGEPSDEISKISLNDECVVIYTKFFNLPIRENKYTCIIYDGSAKIVENATSVMNVQNPTWQIWSKHEFNRNFDAPGLWRFELYIDDVKIVEKTLEVTPGTADKPDAPKNSLNYIGLGINAISHSSQYYGGSYAYATYGRQIYPNVVISLQYSIAAAPFFAEDAFAGAKATYFLAVSRKEKFFTAISASYRKDLGGNDPGSIGFEFSPFTNGPDDERVCLYFLPIECLYNLKNDSWNFSYEFFRVFIKF